MEQAKIEQLAFLYLCSEHDKRLLLKKEKMPLADFDRLTYLIYHFGFKEYHIKVWMEFAGEFKKEWDCLEALQEMGGCVGNIGNGQHEGIVSEELWQKAHTKRMATGIKQPSKIGKDRSHLLTGILKCPICGSSIELYGEKRSDGHLVKAIHFTFPVTYDGESGALFVRTNEQQVETVCLMSRVEGK